MAEMRNLLTDPWPNGTAGWDIIAGTTGSVEFRMCNGARSFLLKRLTASPAYIMISRTLTGLKAGTYVAALQLLDYYESVADNGAVLLARQLGGTTNYGRITAKQKPACLYTQFALPADGGLRIVLQPPAAVNAYYAVDKLLLMTQEDWDTMRNLTDADGTPANIRWFAPPKTAATGVMSTPALDRGGLALTADSNGRCNTSL